MSPLQGFRIREVTIRRFRCATPPVIHDVAASAARNEELAVLSIGTPVEKTKIPLKYYKNR
jgi:hypothetical protein